MAWFGRRAKAAPAGDGARRGGTPRGGPPTGDLTPPTANGRTTTRRPTPIAFGSSPAAAGADGDVAAATPRERRVVGVPPEILRQVKLIELRTRGLVNSLFSGEYRSVFKGQGMEFAEVREYQPGDEVRSIDWNVTARMRRPFVKRYIEERELTVMLAVDLSGSERFGTVRRFKSEVATELGAVIAMSAIRNNDRVGILLFTDRVEHVVPPRKGRRHALRVIRDLLVHEPSGCGTDIPGALEYLGRMLRHHTIVFVISDFQDEGIERPLRVLAQQHDVVAVTVEDPSERELPNVGLARFTDPETGTTLDVDTSDPTVRAQYAARVSEEHAARRQLLRRLAIDEIAVRTDQPVIEPLLKFFRSRETRSHRR
ncbi:MAG TPA: DUF58 domain-containing protein [Gemmatimonadaceae bacterium]|nr:DUF58 domain-containing protein [Gemmatimonadaceae bacterium]